jgi:hypothetical protein
MMTALFVVLSVSVSIVIEKGAGIALGFARYWIKEEALASFCRESHFSVGASGFLAILHDEFS